MVEWLAGNRIRGTSTERTTGSGFNPVDAVTGGWKELASVELNSTQDELSSGTFTAKKYLWVQWYVKKTGTANTRWRFNNDSGQNYASRSHVLGNEATQINQTTIFTHADTSGNAFGTMFIVNDSAKEKLVTAHEVSDSVGRYEGVAKWANTSNQITSIKLMNTDTGGFQSGTTLKVFGYDPDDTHTTNSWEQLGTSTTVTSNAIDVSFTPKKWLFIQGYWKQAPSGTSGAMRFRVGNNTINSGTIYSEVAQEDGGTDTSVTGQTELKTAVTDGTGGVNTFGFFNMFIYNSSSDHKLFIGNVVHNRGTTGSGTPPRRLENTAKWASNDQINIIKLYRNAETLTLGGLTVWGSN